MLEVKIIAEVELASLGIVDEKVAGAFSQNFPVVQQISAIHDAESFAHVVIRYDHADAATFELHDDLLHFGDLDGIDGGKGFIHEQKLWFGHERAGDFQTATLTTRKRERFLFSDMVEA